jgi:lipopolysaccharide/colanic/teichoic acid biosynthesis glycosyltransferase
LSAGIAAEPAWKRPLDLLLASAALALCCPVMLCAAVAVAVSSRGPVMFRQRRVGRGGREFTLLKFRTMRVAPAQTQAGPAAAEQKRITRAGRLLRASKIDELPQLWNVLWGEMSMVGPRPELPRYVRCYPEQYRRILSVRPGITDLASIVYRNEGELLAAAENPEDKYVSEVLPVKLRLNLEYVTRPGLLRDLRLLWLTAGKLLRLPTRRDAVGAPGRARDDRQKRG